MGMEQNKGGGICVEDLVLALKGHIKDGYTVRSLIHQTVLDVLY